MLYVGHRTTCVACNTSLGISAGHFLYVGHRTTCVACNTSLGISEGHVVCLAPDIKIYYSRKEERLAFLMPKSSSIIKKITCRIPIIISHTTCQCNLTCYKPITSHTTCQYNHISHANNITYHLPMISHATCQ